MIICRHAWAALSAVCLVFSMFSDSWSATPPAHTFTIEQAVDWALKSNPSLESKMLILEQARMNVGVAQSYFWPRVSVIASTQRLKNYEEVQTYNSDNLSSYNWTKGWRASLSLFAGFAHLNNLEKSTLNVDIEKARTRLGSLELCSNVQLQFLQLLKSREDLKSAQQQVIRITTQLKSAEAFVDVGMAPYLNVLQNRTDLARAQQQVIRVQNDIRNAEVQLNKYLGFQPNALVRYVGNLREIGSTIGYSEEDALKAAESRRPDLEIARKSIEVAYKDMNITMGRFLPRVDATYDNLGASKDYDDSRYKGYTRNYWAAGLNFSWEVFSGGETTFQSLADRKRAQALRKDYEDALAGARTDVIKALLDIHAAQELIKTSRRGVAAAREGYDMANKRYMTNTGTITELLDAQLRLTQAESDASQALTEFHSARVRFFHYIGKENPTLK